MIPFIRLSKSPRTLTLSTFFTLALSTTALAGGTNWHVEQGTANVSESISGTDITTHKMYNRLSADTLSLNHNEYLNVDQHAGNNAFTHIKVLEEHSHFKQGSSINSNANLAITNRHGMTFHNGSQVNVGSFIASTAADHSINEDGSYNFSNAHQGKITNHGKLVATSQGGFVVLHAPEIENTGEVIATLGQVKFGNASDLTVDFRGDGLIKFGVDKSEADRLGITHSGLIRAGKITLDAKTASNVAKSVINLDGVIDATSFAKDGDGGSVLVESSGDINMNKVTIKTDAQENGDGGRFYSWADGTNSFSKDATITSKGGQISGDGGFIEVSGNNVKIAGTPDASAENGQTGQFVIDPFNLDIKDDNGIAGVNEVYEEYVEGISQSGTDIELRAERVITLKDLADNELTGGAGSIKLVNADDNGVRTINEASVLFEDVNDTIRTTTGDIIIQAGGGSLTNPGVRVGHLKTGDMDVENPGAVRIDTIGKSDVEIGSIEVIGKQAGTIDIYSDGDLSTTGDITMNIINDAGNATAKATIRAANRIEDINGDINILADASASNTDVTADAQLNVRAGVDPDNGIARGTFRGDVMVTANAQIVGGTGEVNANAESEIITGDYARIFGTAGTSSFVSTNGSANDANASSKLSIQSGTNRENTDVDVREVFARANVEAPTRRGISEATTEVLANDTVFVLDGADQPRAEANGIIATIDNTGIEGVDSPIRLGGSTVSVSFPLPRTGNPSDTERRVPEFPSLRPGTGDSGVPERDYSAADINAAELTPEELGELAPAAGLDVQVGVVCVMMNCKDETDALN